MKEQSIARIFIGVSTFITQSLMIFFFLKVIQPVFSQNAVLASPAQVRVSTSKSYKDEISAEADPQHISAQLLDTRMRVQEVYDQMWGGNETEMRKTIIEAYADFCRVDVYNSQDLQVPLPEQDTFQIEQAEFRKSCNDAPLDGTQEFSQKTE